MNRHLIFQMKSLEIIFISPKNICFFQFRSGRMRKRMAGSMGLLFKMDYKAVFLKVNLNDLCFQSMRNEKAFPINVNTTKKQLYSKIRL